MNLELDVPERKLQTRQSSVHKTQRSLPPVEGKPRNYVDNIHTNNRGQFSQYQYLGTPESRPNKIRSFSVKKLSNARKIDSGIRRTA
jgi:hypothetical protein